MPPRYPTLPAALPGNPLCAPQLHLALIAKVIAAAGQGDGCPDLSPYLSDTLTAKARVLAEWQECLLRALPNRALAGGRAASENERAGLFIWEEIIALHIAPATREGTWELRGNSELLLYLILPRSKD